MTTTTLSTRPAMHFTPKTNWMNDPNGLIHHGGRYHLYFQYNPYGDDWGHMSWGHASSADLLEWTEHPVALLHDENEAVFSGSIVFDARNSSNLGTTEEPPLIALYTSARQGSQAQALASSTDGGETWIKHGIVLDRGTADFRDPKVFRYLDHWILVAVEALDRQVHLFRSDDLQNWSPLSVFGPAGAPEGIWECPDLFPIDGRWVLVLSMNPGNPAGGSGMQYFVGDFDGTTFTHTSWDWLDRGRDFYAAVTVSDAPAPVLIGWMSNWDYAHAIPSSPWRGSATLPRRLELRGERLVQRPAVDLAKAHDYLAGPLTLSDVAVPLPEGAHGRVARIKLVARPGRGAVDLVLRASPDGSVGTTVRLVTGEVSLDRRRSGHVSFSDKFASVSKAPLSPSETVELNVWIDISSVEVFAEAGAITITEQIFPADENITVFLRVTEDATVQSVKVTVLER